MADWITAFWQCAWRHNGKKLFRLVTWSEPTMQQLNITEVYTFSCWAKSNKNCRAHCTGQSHRNNRRKMVWSMRLCYPSSLACDSLVFRLVILNFKKEQRFRFIEIIVSGRGVKLIAFLLALFPTSVTYNRIVGKGRWRVSPYNITPESHIRVTKIKNIITKEKSSWLELERC